MKSPKNIPMKYRVKARNRLKLSKVKIRRHIGTMSLGFVSPEERRCDKGL
jgi:hypothetical protein